MTDKEIKALLKETAEDIRRRQADKADVVDVLLNLAAVIEHMHPDTLRSRELEVREVVHVLSGGVTLCGMRESPKDWAAGHKWIPPFIKAKDETTCPSCRRKLEKN